MRRIPIRELSLELVFAIIVSVTYRFWLTYPILRNLTLGEWRAVAILVAAVFGIASALIRLPAYFGPLAMTVGLSLGGAWASLSAPHDVRTTFLAEFTGHLEIFWREVVLLTTISLICSLCCARILQKKPA